MPLPTPSVRLPSRCSRTASEAAQAALRTAQHAHHQATTPYTGFDRTHLDAGTHAQLAHHQRIATDRSGECRLGDGSREAGRVDGVGGAVVLTDRGGD
jgi:hypothetical protein